MVKILQNISWTKEKTFALIGKYEKNECLWNCHTEDYKSREKRDSAISKICESMKISREQFSKKIHNLRNQFNYESKKICKSNVVQEGTESLYNSKWEYFNALTFLKGVIAPRPGFGTSTSSVKNYEGQQITNENEEISIEVDEQLSRSSVKSYVDEIHKNTITNGLSSSVESPSDDKEQKCSVNFPNKTDSQILDETCTSIIIKQSTELGSTDELHHCDSQIFEIQPVSKRHKSNNNDQSCQDNQNNNSSTRNCERNEYDVFGEFVAGELKSLNSLISRKKLKRKIMEAILVIATEDEQM